MIKKQSQFLHLDTYARVIPKASTQQQWTAFDILKEAARDAEHSKHVKNAQRPEILFGESPEKIIAMIENIDNLRTGKSRKYRKDLKVLMSGVASFPTPMDKLKSDDKRMLASFETATRNFLYKQFGSALVSVVAHYDESFPHIHFYVLPDLANGQKMADLHPGMKARAECGGGKNAKAAAVARGLANFQDEYFREVSCFFGHERVSDSPRARQRYAFWQVQKALKSKISQLNNIIKRIIPWNEITSPPKLKSETNDLIL
ncbi:plasmid recombination protein [Terasakiella pusilla]|uniref:plasmid recombination protein n=1 Tax=Terasakiella pusilla TaxID=64973 RepID=UPI003AA9A922